MTKSEAGRLGGLATLKKYGRKHFVEAGRLGAQRTWSKYQLVPYRTSNFAMVDRETGEVKAFLKGVPF